MNINQADATTQDVINTIAPISIVDLKKYFANKNLTYIIDYAGSTLKGNTLLTYLSNLDLPCDVSGFADQSEIEELLRAYFESPFIVRIPALEKLAIAVLFEFKGLIEPSALATFIAANKDIITHWANVLDSCMVYNLFIVNAQELKDMALQYPHNATTSMEGVNFVNLLQYKEFYASYSKVSNAEMQFYDHYFNNSVFKGEGLYKYWANENNPIFLLTFGIAEGIAESNYMQPQQDNLEKNNAAPI